MNFFLFLPLVMCSIRILKEDVPVRCVRELLRSTVVLIETQVYRRRGEDQPFQEVGDGEEDIEINLSIFAANEKDWTKIYSNGTFIAEYVRAGGKNSFFFTASASTYFLFQFSGSLPERDEYGLGVRIYEGKQNDPRIVSQADTQIKDLEAKISRAIGFTKQISDIQRMDMEDEEEYKTLFSNISSLIFYSILLKIFVFFTTFFYFNRKIREFYVSKRIVVK
jgi:hypothetical protein